jgi:hypothetical protein
MNTNKLKKFAQETRRKLLKQVNGKLEYVLNTDSSELRGKAQTVKELKKELEKQGREALVDKVAYTWFNRLVALRYMDARGYQPLEMSILTPQVGQVSPQILQEAMAGHIPSELKVDHQVVMDILDGRTFSSNPENEAYRLLLVASCNHLHAIFPFLFEAIDDYTELLLPDDLTSEFSMVQDVIDGMTEEDCQEVEILGWLYQFYISEKKDELINAKKKYKPSEIAPVTQLFTPKWLVKFMVDNSLGQYWKEVNPKTQLTDDLEFYISSQNPELIPKRAKISPEDITFFDPCVGSGHILTYAFDLFYKMYEEEGYVPSQIPELILTKNLYGIDIDERASQIAGFALMVKGREKNRNLFKKQIALNVMHFVNVTSYPKFENAKVLGSLIEVSQEELDQIPEESDTLFGEQNKKVKQQAQLLASKYDVVVTNPPYLNSSYMENDLKKFVNDNYSDTRSDLFACFLVRVTKITKKDGLIGFICPYVWMFIKSYEKLREFVIDETTLNTLVQLEYNAFGPAVVPICSFTLRNHQIESYVGSYIKLSDFKGIESQSPKTLEAIQNPDCGWFYTANQNDFEKIPGNPIGYFFPKKLIISFEGKLVRDYCKARIGLVTGNSKRFLRNWFEISVSKSNIKSESPKWYKYQKGGAFRKWYGNNEYVINWEDDGHECKNENSTKSGRVKSHNYNGDYAFRQGIVWTKITSTHPSFRKVNEGFMFDDAGPLCWVKDEKWINPILSFLNSKPCRFILETLSPTLNLLPGHLHALPIVFDKDELSLPIEKQIDWHKKEWDIREASWNFQQNELIRFNNEGGIETLEESYEVYKQYWTNQFFKLHQNEEELNRQFIEIYGLQEELTSEVPLEEITILQEELDKKKLKKLDKEFRGRRTGDGGPAMPEHGHLPELPFKDKEVFAQFVSYAVGCMFGRYSLDQEGLILANQGETLEDYLEKVFVETHPSIPSQEGKFIPDDDNIIPVLDDEWFEDDIVFRFHEFLKASFGEANFQQNLAFVEEQLGYDIRKYFDKYFYKDHFKRYNKRPIYWKFSSPKGYFSVLIYMHRYTSDTLNNILNNYLREFVNKLKTRKEQMQHLENTGSASEKAQASKEIDKLNAMIADCQNYEREILYPLASERIEMDLDDGVLVNYNLFGQAVEEIKSVNDKKKKKKVKEFDWIDGERVRG